MKQSAREKNETKKWRFLLGILTVILAAGGFCASPVSCAPVFPIGTKLSGVSVSEQSAKEAGETLQQAAEDYKLTVRFAQNTRTFSAKELGLTVDEDALKRLVKVMQQGQNAASAAEDAQTVFTCETDLKEEMQDLPERTAHADKAIQDAVLTYDKKAGEVRHPGGAGGRHHRHPSPGRGRPDGGGTAPAGVGRGGRGAVRRRDRPAQR